MISQQIETKINLLTSLTVPLVWYNSKYCFIYEHRNKTTHTHTREFKLSHIVKRTNKALNQPLESFQWNQLSKIIYNPKRKKNTQNNRRKPERNNIRQIKIEKKMNKKINNQKKRERETETITITNNKIKKIMFNVSYIMFFMKCTCLIPLISFQNNVRYV